MDAKQLAKCRRVAGECVFLHIRKASRAVAQHYNSALQESGLLGTQFSLLVALSLLGPSPVTRLGEKMVMDRTTLTRNLKPLERAGLVALARGEDRRTRLVELTPRGREALARALPLWEKAQARMVQQLGPHGWRGLLAELNTVVELARKG